MPHPDGGQGTYFNPIHTFHQAHAYIAKGPATFNSTTGERITAQRGMAQDNVTPTIVFQGENCVHGNVYPVVSGGLPES